MTATTLLSSRVGAIDTLTGTAADIDGDQSLDFELPAGYGDALLLGWRIVINTIDVLMTNPEIHGPNLQVVQVTAGVARDMVNSGDVRWVRVGSGANAAALVASEHLRTSVSWRTDESIRIRFVEVDTDATPTADLSVIFLVMRLRSP